MNDTTPASHLSEHRRLASATYYTSRVIGNLLDRWFSPQSILDLGCGNGVWMRGLQIGRREVLGVEHEHFTPDELEVDADLILHADLGKKVDLHRSFDLVMCLEVAEHINPACAETVVENCIRHSSIVLFSAAIPGQQGLEHINEQLPEYWARLFDRHGYLPLDMIRPLIWDDPQIPVWYRQNMLLYVHRDAPGLTGLQAYMAASLASLPLNRAHPELMLWFSQDASATHQANDALREQIRVESARIGAIQTELSEVRAAADASRAAADASAAGLAAEQERLEAEVRRLDEDRRLVVQEHETLAVRHQILAAELNQLNAQRDLLAVEHERLNDAHDRLWQERDIIINSTLWRALGPVRASMHRLPSPVRRLARQTFHRIARWSRQSKPLPPPKTPLVDDVTDAPSLPSERSSIIFISGEPDTPGHCYRVLRAVAAATAVGATAKWRKLDEAMAHLDEVISATAVMIWRSPWSADLAELIKVAKHADTKIIYDIDDLMFLPELARVEIIDGIRSQQFDAAGVAALYDRIRTALLASDICTCTTTEIALEVRAYQKTAIVLPNGFDDALCRRSRSAVRKWLAANQAELVRIGYAAGSRTHQRDFAVAAEAVARVLHERSNCRLVLFRAGQTPLIDIEEFPALLPLARQIEWRQMRPVEELPDELARFDINLAPLEVGNPFCEAKSELKFFEAALVDVPTIASPTGPFQRCIRDGVTGALAVTPDDWYDRLIELVDDPPLRRRVGHAAYHDVTWTYGPQRRQEHMALLLSQIQGGSQAARAIELDVLRTAARRQKPPEIRAAETVLHHDRLHEAEVTVVIPVYNYAQYVVEALESVRRQTLGTLDLVVVDDASTDESLEVVSAWAEQNRERFNRLIVLRNRTNSGLSLTRNAAIDAAETPFVFPLDADNRMRPTCCEACIEVLRSQTAAFAYPQIQYFGDSDDVIGVPPFEPMRLAGGNYIDAMALVTKWAWAAVGGYRHLRHGWEDYDFWCSLVEHGCWGIAVPRVLADYRVHRDSMLHTTTDIRRNKRELIQELEQRHSWLEIPCR